MSRLPRLDSWYRSLDIMARQDIADHAKMLPWPRIRDYIEQKYNLKPSRSAYYRFLCWYENSKYLDYDLIASMRHELVELHQAIRKLNKKVTTIGNNLGIKFYKKKQDYKNKQD